MAGSSPLCGGTVPPAGADLPGTDGGVAGPAVGTDSSSNDGGGPAPRRPR